MPGCSSSLASQVVMRRTSTSEPATAGCSSPSGTASARSRTSPRMARGCSPATAGATTTLSAHQRGAWRAAGRHRARRRARVPAAARGRARALPLRSRQRVHGRPRAASRRRQRPHGHPDRVRRRSGRRRSPARRAVECRARLEELLSDAKARCASRRCSSSTPRFTPPWSPTAGRSPWPSAPAGATAAGTAATLGSSSSRRRVRPRPAPLPRLDRR